MLLNFNEELKYIAYFSCDVILKFLGVIPVQRLKVVQKYIGELYPHVRLISVTVLLLFASISHACFILTSVKYCVIVIPVRFLNIWHK